MQCYWNNDLRGVNIMKGPKVYVNPPDYRYFWFITAISLACGFGSGIVLFLIRGNSYLVLILGILIGILGIVTVWHREFINRPKEVELSERGLILSFRYGLKRRVVQWNEIIGSYGFSEEGGGALSRTNGVGILALADKAYATDHHISRAIYEAYYEYTGKHLSEWKKGEDYKSFKKRVYDGARSQ
jgi:hypothetical protein